MQTNRLYSIAIYALIPLLVGWSFWPQTETEAKNEGVNSNTEMVKKAEVPKEEPESPALEAGLYDRNQLTKTDRPKPRIEFWDELARCETGSNWQNPGRFSGGVGIMNTGTFAKGVLGQSQMGTWERWGGEEFAPTPQEATKEQQILVGNRIALWGWEVVVDRGREFAERHGVPQIYHYKKEPVGFGGWGALPCAGGKPKQLFHYDDPDKLMLIKYEWGEKSVAVLDLQVLMGMKTPTGVYDDATRKKHIEGLNYWGLTKAGVPEKPLTQQDIAAKVLMAAENLVWFSN